MRRLQFSLRTLLIVVTLICVALGVYIGPKVRRHNIVRTIEDAGGSVHYADRAADESWVTEKLRRYLPNDWFDEIYRVDLRGKGVNDATIDGFGTLACIQELSLDDSKISDAGLIHLKDLAGLKILTLSRTQITDAGLVHLKNLSGLKRLTLDGTQVTLHAWNDLHVSLPNCFIPW